jgi:hypothetical protein
MISFVLRLFVPVVAASTIIGNPNTTLVLDNGADVYVHSIRLYPCSGDAVVVPVDVTLDASDTEPVVFDGGTYCDVVVRLKWNPSGSIQPVAVSGFDALAISNTGDAFSIVLDESTHEAWID